MGGFSDIRAHQYFEQPDILMPELWLQEAPEVDETVFGPLESLPTLSGELIYNY